MIPEEKHHALGHMSRDCSGETCYQLANFVAAYLDCKTHNLVGMVVDEFIRVRPATPLQTFVAWYSGYRQIGVPAALHRGLPSPFLTLIFTMDDPLTLAQHSDPAQTPDSYDALLAGLHTAAAVVAHDGRQSGVQIAVSPLASRALFGMPASALTGSNIHAADVLGTLRVDEIRTALRGSRTWRQRVGALNRLLWRDAAPERAVAPEVGYAWRRLCRTRGRIPVRALAGETGWSARHLQTRFRVETGLTPKQAARVIRFDAARHALACAPGRNLSDIAADHGYYDQPHLVREFHRLAGCAPSTWLSEEFRNIQGGMWAPPTDSLS